MINEDTIYTVLIIITVILLAAALGIVLFEEHTYYGTVFGQGG